MDAPFNGKRLADMRLLMHAVYRCITSPSRSV